jgi:hypothetical protein
MGNRDRWRHKVYRVPGFLFSRRNWVPPPPHPLASVAPPPLGPRGGDTLARGRGAGGTYSEEGTDTVVSLYTILLFGWRYVWYERRRWGSSYILSKL